MIFFAFILLAHYPGSPVSLDDWFMSLHSGNGVCCNPIEARETDYTRVGGTYFVPLDNATVKVPERAIVYAPNKAGKALIWLYPGYTGSERIRCFLPMDVG